MEIFHTGYVVKNLESAAAELSEMLGVAWTETVQRPLRFRQSGREMVVDLKFAYTTGGGPAIELVEEVAGTIWTRSEGAPDLEAHHVGVWSSDVPGTSAALVAAGSPLLATYAGPGDGAHGFAYHRLSSGFLVEYVDASRRPGFEAWFRGGEFPAPASAL